MEIESIDVSTLTNQEIRQAIITNGNRMGSYAYYVQDEIERALRDKAGVTVYRDIDGQLRAYYKTPEQRRVDAEAAAWKPGMPPVKG